MFLKSYFESLLEILYPERNTCLLCGKYDDNLKEKYICENCYTQLDKLTGNLCTRCSKPVNNIQENNLPLLCNDCIKNIRYFKTVKSPLKYTKKTQKIIFDYKYYNKVYYYKVFGSILYDFMLKNNYQDFDLITSVPLHKSKLQTRGYNQSELLAKYISKKTNIPYKRCLTRVKKTKVQNSLSKIKRQKNIKGAFLLKDMHIINSKKILIIDDIYTTGATINECSKILVENGAFSVSGLTIARG